MSVKHFIQFLANSKHSVKVGYEKGLMTTEEEEEEEEEWGGGGDCHHHPDRL